MIEEERVAATVTSDRLFGPTAKKIQEQVPHSRPRRKPEPGEAEIGVFVHLAHDKDADSWRRAFLDGRLVGVNDETPYGYGRASRMGCTLAYARAEEESALGKLSRLAVRALTGFDYLHALHQRAALRKAEIIWTHTESQFLAVAAVLGPKAGPKLLGQSVWLFDTWHSLTPLHKALYRRLIRRVDVLTVHSEDNLRVARQLFPNKRVELVRYGIASENWTPPKVRASRPIRIVAPGSDRHRDWKTLIEAVRGRGDMELTILSGTADPGLVGDARNIRLGRATTNAELAAELDSATLLCVPLHPNKHASGITVLQEAVLAGTPVVASDTGGLRGYFGPDEVRYVPPGDVEALRAAILDVASNAEASSAMAARAQARMTNGTIGAEAFIRRHVEISREILNR